MATLQEIMRAGGIVADPDLVIAACTKTGLPLNIECAVLDKESYSGRNVFGNDNVAYPTSGPYTADTVDVTREAVEAYLAWRGPGPGAASSGRQNGVGPNQLTYWDLQDEAEARGGLHLPGPNMETGCARLKKLLDANGGDLRTAAGLYNGGKNWQQNAGATYAEFVVNRSSLWTTRFNGAGTTPPPATPGADLPTIRYGERSENVRRLQDWSNWYAWSPVVKVVSETGYYGNDTKEMVRQIQQRLGVTGSDADGSIVGPRTNAGLAARGYPNKS